MCWAAAEVCLTATRDGSWYLGTGSGEGGGFLSNVSFGYIAGPGVTNGIIDAFVNGGSLTASGGTGPSAGITWGNEGQYGGGDYSYEFGFGKAGYGLMQTGSNLWFKLPWLG